MGVLNIWLSELVKYKAIIDLSKHIKFQLFSKNVIDHLLVQLKQDLDKCQLTTRSAAHVEQAPLYGGKSLFVSNLSEEDIEREIQRAQKYYERSLKIIEKAASGKLVYQILSHSEILSVLEHFSKSINAEMLKDYVLVGDLIHLYDEDLDKFNKMKNHLESNGVQARLTKQQD